VAVGRYFPSSKMCRHCGHIREHLALRDRTWTCPGCGAVLRRDPNSGGNIFDEGRRLLAAGYTERLNAQYRSQ
jgi:putative transposase